MYNHKYTKYKNKNLQLGGMIYDINNRSCDKNNRSKFLDYIISCSQIETINETVFFNGILRISGVNFSCAVLLKYPQKFSIFFLDMTLDLNRENLTNNDIYDNSYIILNFDDSDKVSTRFNLPIIPNKNKLETILEILDTLYFHFCYETIELRDIAEFNCPSPVPVMIEYNANLYRIFYTDKPLEEISIYTRGGYTYSSRCTQEDLDFLRNYNVSDFRDFLITLRFHNNEINKARINLIHKLKLYNEYSLHHFFKNSEDVKINSAMNCHENYIYLKLLESIKRGSSKHPFAMALKRFCACVSNLEKNYKE